MNAILYHGFAPHYPILAADIDLRASQPSPQRDLGFATIAVSSRLSAQGPVLRRFRDGRVTINSGNGPVTGHPIGGTAPKGWWGRMFGTPDISPPDISPTAQTA